MSTCIYLLLCPMTREVRYVGKTSIDLQQRLKQHLYEAKKMNLGQRGIWLRELLADGLSPLIIEDVPCGDDDWQEVERNRIAHYHTTGCRLVNGTEGGEGLFKPTREVLSRMSASAIARAATAEGKKHLQSCGRNTGPLNKGKKKPPHVGIAVAKSNRARTVSQETRMKMSVTRKGRKYSADHCQKIREGKLRFEARRRMAALQEACAKTDSESRRTP